MKIDYQLLQAETLDNLLTEIVLREGTDYGAEELSIDTKKQQLLRRLQSGDAVIVYNDEHDHCDVMSAEQVQQEEVSNG